MKRRVDLAHRVAHLVKRWWWAVRAQPVDDADRAWVASVLSPAEMGLFDQMSPADTDHHLRVARRMAERLGPEAPATWLAAALLHDVGKLVCGLGTWARVGATVWPWPGAGDSALARYRRHEAIGATLAKAVGSDAVTVALIAGWSEAPGRAARALAWADDV